MTDDEINKFITIGVIICIGMFGWAINEYDNQKETQKESNNCIYEDIIDVTQSDT